MKLFDHPVSPYSFKVRATLYEKGIDFEKHEIWHRDQGEELLRVNPRAEVPALQDGDTVLYDSTVICEYLEEKFPAPPLLGGDPVARARCRAVEIICDTQADACVYIIALFKIFRPGLEPRCPEPFAKAGATLLRLYGHLDAMLGQREWFAGEFSRADIALYPHVAAAVYLGFPIGEAYPHLAGWFARAQKRASLHRAFQEAMAALERSESETDQFFTNDRLHWRSDRIEMALRVGLGPWLLGDLEAGGAFLPPVP